MKFVPKEIPENVNVSKTSPIKEFFILLGGILGIILLSYIILGWAVDFTAPRVSPEIEKQLGKLVNHQLLPEKSDSVKSAYLQGIMDRLTRESCISLSFPIRVHYDDTDIVNAVALPGGEIIVYKGLLDDADSENELAFVLGHELGHFHNKDHLRSLGRGLVATVLATALLGNDNALSTLFSQTIDISRLSTSREQERAADKTGLALLNCAYGHVAGSTAFFEGLEDQNTNLIRRYMASHPATPDRIATLKKLIRSQNYPSDSLRLIPIPF